MAAPGGGVRVEVEGLAKLRRDLRRMQPAALKEIRGVLRDAAGVVAADAARNAPRLTGALAKSIRPGTSGNRAFVRSRLPYAGVHEYGGRISPQGTPISIKRSAFIARAIEAKQEQIVDELGDGIERVATKHGWH